MTSAQRSAPGVAVLVLITGILLSGATFLMKTVTGSESTIYQLIDIAFIAVGVVTIWRRPNNRVSWLFAWLAVALPFVEFVDQYATLHYAHGGSLPLASVAAWLSSWSWTVVFGPLATLLFLWFPTGRIPSPRWRWIERAAFGLIVVAPLLFAFAEDPQSSAPYSNPLASEDITRVVESISVVIELGFPLIVLACVGSLVARYRSGDPEQRQQLKWFTVGATGIGVYMLVDTVVGAVSRSSTNGFAWRLAEVATFLSLPAAAAIAILKYRLYDIDIIINRTLVYGAVTTALAGVYLLSIMTLQAILPLSENSDLAVAASTLAVAALFRPLRARLQSFIDRRFYRSKYDAATTLGAFAARLRDRVELDAVRREVVDIAITTMRPTHASLWIRTLAKDEQI